MAKGLKVVTIGGGSSYTPELVEGFIKRYDEFPISELWLVDIEAGKEKLEIVGNLAKRMVKKAGLPIEVHLTLDRRKALVDADFVTTQFRVGLLEARMKDERIPLKYDVIGQETNGPGGLFKGLRTIPVILEIVKDIEELCPDAWLVNFTNPVVWSQKPYFAIQTIAKSLAYVTYQSAFAWASPKDLMSTQAESKSALPD